MEIAPDLVWIIGVLVLIGLAVLVAKKVNVTVNGKELKIKTDKTEESKKVKSNVMIIKSSNNKLKQDANNEGSNTFKQNIMKVTEDGNEAEQDVGNVKKSNQKEEE
jgi:Na+-transporting NADH:ubiquinone oxidoreductase subunit NqrF